MENAKEFIARRAARELRDGYVVNLGIGLPTMIPKYLPASVQVILQSENGIIGTGPTPSPEEADPMHVVDAGGKPAAILPTGAFFDSAFSFSLIRGGHVDMSILGALAVDQEGNLANWIVPGKKVTGMGGAMDLVVGSKRVIIAMEHTVHGEPKIFKKVTLPLTAVKCVDDIITEMGFMTVTDQGLVLTEYNPEFTIEQIQAATDAELIIPDNIKPMAV
jgi:acetate CoA/acetoacetate CoA-transferase beta subunit